jgi:hypothetical protein
MNAYKVTTNTETHTIEAANMVRDDDGQSLIFRLDNGEEVARFHTAYVISSVKISGPET